MRQKIAIVTGANRGLGKEITRQLAQEQIKVIITARDQSKGLKVLKEFEDHGLDVIFHQLDVTDEQSIQTLFQFVNTQYGQLDILVNNAGILIDGKKSVLEIDLETARKTMETNVYGPLRLAQVFVPLLEKSDEGRIVNMSSGVGAIKSHRGQYPIYSLSKTGLNVITMHLAYQLKGTSVKVNTMCPGWVKTDMGGPSATRTVDKGAETAVWLATSKEVEVTGKFFRDKREITF